MRLLRARKFNPGDRRTVDSEEPLSKISFTVHKFTPRRRPDNPANVVIFPHFSEFGSELVESIYTLPMQMNGQCLGKYSIVLGWYGRAYLYKHLVDEFWEIGQDNQYLRDYSRAFHHDSKNLKKAEKEAARYGRVVDTAQEYGLDILYPRLTCCQECKGSLMFTENGQICVQCHRNHHRVGIYYEINHAKSRLAVWPPLPSSEKLRYVEKYLQPNSVGVTARHRNCYGRNLPKEFYERLVIKLEEMGYAPIWIGEKETTLRAPFNHITDFCLTEDASDLETTLALVSKLKFTVQLWTASTRLAGLVGTPWVLVESPDQIWGVGQEGIRLNLCTKGKGKLVLAHYVNVNEDHVGGVNMIERAISEIQTGNYADLIGMVESPIVVEDMRQKNESRISGN